MMLCASDIYAQSKTFFRERENPKLFGVTALAFKANNRLLILIKPSQYFDNQEGSHDPSLLLA
jgi:hypothetical protein